VENGDQHLARRFSRAAAKVADHAWKMATGADLALPDVEGARTVQVRLVNAYMDRLLAVAAHDPAVAASFIRVAGMVDPLPALLRPALAMRVLRPHGQPSGPPGPPDEPVDGQPGTTSVRTRPPRQQR
jgi:hypothetical protein